MNTDLDCLRTGIVMVHANSVSQTEFACVAVYCLSYVLVT